MVMDVLHHDFCIFDVAAVRRHSLFVDENVGVGDILSCCQLWWRVFDEIKCVDGWHVDELRGFIQIGDKY